MQFASCRYQDHSFAAAIIGAAAVPLADIAELGTDTPSTLLASPPLRESAAVPLSDVILRPTIPRPGKIICVGLNYLTHVGETGRDVPEYPVLFTKFAESLIADREPILLPHESQQVDFEGELAVVIGLAGRRIPRSQALAHVAGYTIANDITMRDYQYKTHQWLQGKTWERSTPLGPYLVSPDEVGDPAALNLQVTLNSTVMQQASTAQMMFDVPTLIACISEFVTLAPGDVLMTGTPGGVGFRRDPKVFLQPGDDITVQITGLGMLHNTVGNESGPELSPMELFGYGATQ